MVQEFVQTILKTQSVYRQAIQRKMRESDIELSFEMLNAIKRLAKYEVINQQELAKILTRDKSSLSYLIKSMEKKGFVVRKEDEKDKRNKLVKLTEEGKKIHENVMAIIKDVYSSIEANINQKHIELCIEYMNEFNAVIQEKED